MQNTQENSENSPKPPSAPKSFPYFVSGSIPNLHGSLYEKMVDLLLRKGLFFNSDSERRKSPFKFRTPEQLKKIMDFDLHEGPLVEDKDRSKELLRIMEFVIDYSPHVSHPYMVSKNCAGLDPYGIIGDWLSTTMSVPVLTYFVAPVFTLMELEVQERFRNLLQWPRGQGDGIVTPGHGIGNSYVIQIALQTKFPGIKEGGFFKIGNPKAVMFISEQGDYSFEKYCIWEGLGSAACIKVSSDVNGRMNVKDLLMKVELAESEGFIPFLVIATAGTNVLGAIDPIDKIASVAEAKSMWLHVDGHLAGSCVFSTKHGQRLCGIEKSDSCLWSPDKMLAAPFSTNILVTKESHKMRETFVYETIYLEEQDKFYDHEKWDTADNTMQTTRRPDILKIWFMWKAKGTKGLGDQVDGTYANAALCVEELKSRSGRFELILPEFDSNLVCFYFVPGIIEHMDQMEIVNIIVKNEITQLIKNKLLGDGILEISLGQLPSRKDLPCFFVMNMNNTAVTLEDIQYMLDQIEYCGNSVFVVNKLSSGLNGSIWNDSISIERISEIMLQYRIQPKIPPAPSVYPKYVSAPIASMHKKMFEEYFKIAFEIGTYFQEGRGVPESLPCFMQPEELLQAFDVSLDSVSSCVRGKEENDDGSYASVDELMNIVKSVIKFSVKQGHPYFMFQLVAALDPYTMMADYITACITSPMFTYEDGPVFTLMEEAVTDAVLKRSKFNEGAGFSIVGGSLGNQLAILLAYMRKFSDSKILGNSSTNKDCVIFMNFAGHFSNKKGAFFKGIGHKNCVFVKIDAAGKMDINDLRNKILETRKCGKVPFMVCATAGTTALGAFDPLPEIAKVCEENDMWLHVDGAYGGSCVMSDAQSFRLDGLERADSFNFNPHKMFGAAGYTTNFVTKHEAILTAVAPSVSNQYFGLNCKLYNGRKYDQGLYHAQTDRRPDIFKMWFLWKAKGTIGLSAHVDRAYELTLYANERLQQLYKETKRFVPMLKESEPESPNINFIYVPPQLQAQFEFQWESQAHKVKWEENLELKDKIDFVQNAILEKGVFDQKLVVSVAGIGNGGPNGLILCLYNSCLMEEDIDYFFKLIDFYGQRLDLD